MVNIETKVWKKIDHFFLPWIFDINTIFKKKGEERIIV